MAGRLASVATSMLLSTTTLVNIHLALSLSGALLFTKRGASAFAVACISMDVIGFGLALLYPNGIVIAEHGCR